MLPRAVLGRLCEGDDNLDDLAQLRRAMLSRSVLLLRAVHELLMRGHAGDGGREEAAADLARNVAALSGLHRARPDVVAPLLRGPHFVAWVSHCVRRLVGDGEPSGAVDAKDADDVSLGVDLAQLGCFVAVAALRADAEVEVVVPVRDGQLIMPATGVLQIRGAWTGAHAVLRCRAGKLSVQVVGTTVAVSTLTVATDDWCPLERHLEDLPDGRQWEVVVDAADPYFACFRLPRMRADRAAEAQGLRRFLGPAYAVLSSVFPHKMSAIATDISCLVPLVASGDAGLSATAAEAPGAIALTDPTSTLGLAATLVHEHQHLKLNALDALVQLCGTGPARYYSPWRDDRRPASGLLHGAYAFLGIAEFWRRLDSADSSLRSAPLMQFARITRQLTLACTTLRQCPELTDAGADLVEHIAARAQAWRTASRSPEIERVADDLVLEHRVRWRLRHAAHPAHLTRWTVALFAVGDEGDEGAVANTIEPSERQIGYGSESGLSVSARLWATGRRVEHRADRLLLDGHYGPATAVLTDRMTALAPLEDWARLVVAARHSDLGARCPLLHTHPELVRAVYMEARQRFPSIGMEDVVDRLPDEPPPQVAGTLISLSVRM